MGISPFNYTMKIIQTALLVLLSTIGLFCTAQQLNKSTTQNDIFASMDANADSILRKTGTYSVSIGIVKDGKTYTRHYGELDKGQGNTANNNTLFEIASVTKICTGLLMAQAVLEGKIKLNDDIREYINGNYPNIEYEGHPVRIKDVISFKTGLDRDLPDTRELRKKISDSTAFYFRKLDEPYSKEKFFKDLKVVKVDTIPGTKYKYSNLSLELSAHILENVYHKSYAELLKKNIFSKLNMKSTRLNVPQGKKIANGYNENHVLMPHLINHLWGSEGYLKSNLNDLTKFLAYQLDTTNRIVRESQRNVLNSKENWYGYFWDGIEVADNGKFCHKQGGAYGTQTFFTVFPERNLGIVIIVNINAPNTYDEIFNAVLRIVEDLKPESKAKQIYGYKLIGDKVIFIYTHPETLNAGLINSVNVAGSFNKWNFEDKAYRMTARNNNIFELAIPKSQFKKGEMYRFKFIINNSALVTAPRNAFNVEKSLDRNLTLKVF